MTTAYQKLTQTLKAPKPSQFTGEEVTIEFRVRDRGVWRLWCKTYDYIAHFQLPKLCTDKIYEFRSV